MTGAVAVVVGGGPAGLMAAEVLATAGITVHVYEHMPSVGRKLLLAGRSGLNITHSEPLPALLARYGDATAVRSAVAAFEPSALREWCASLGEATYVGSSGRVFPTAFRATPLLRAWLARLRDLGVHIHVRHRWVGWVVDEHGLPDSRRLRFHHDGRIGEVVADVVVLALGGASWPRVGSDGAWVPVLRAAGIDVRTLRPSNSGVRVAWSEVFTQQYAGVPLKNVALAVAGVTVRGDITITTDGLESGPVYTQSAAVRDACERAHTCRLTIDLHPDLDASGVLTRLRKRRPKDSVSNTLRRTLGLQPVALGVLREATGNQLPADDAALAALVKAVPLTSTGVMPLARAISTAGGIALAEIDDQFMLRRLAGVFVAGEMLDWDAPTGGYLLQASFSTAVAAAHGAAAWLATRTGPPQFSERPPAGR